MILVFKMRCIVLILCCFLVYSCHYFDKKKHNTEDILQEELETFNWNDVDIYPKFVHCDSIIEKNASKTCFQNTIVKHVQNYMSEQEFVVSKDIDDTIHLNFEVDKQGVLTIKALNIKQDTRAEIPQIDSLLRASIKDLPKLFPAIKHSQQVTTKFTLPVLVKIQ